MADIAGTDPSGDPGNGRNRGGNEPGNPTGPGDKAREGGAIVTTSRDEVIGRIVIMLPKFSDDYLFELANRMHEFLAPPEPRLRIVPGDATEGGAVQDPGTAR